jgi:hypothetical protein
MFLIGNLETNWDRRDENSLRLVKGRTRPGHRFIHNKSPPLPSHPWIPPLILAPTHRSHPPTLHGHEITEGEGVSIIIGLNFIQNWKSRKNTIAP